MHHPSKRWRSNGCWNDAPFNSAEAKDKSQIKSQTTGFDLIRHLLRSRLHGAFPAPLSQHFQATRQCTWARSPGPPSGQEHAGLSTIQENKFAKVKHIISRHVHSISSALGIETAACKRNGVNEWHNSASAIEVWWCNFSAESAFWKTFPGLMVKQAALSSCQRRRFLDSRFAPSSEKLDRPQFHSFGFYPRSAHFADVIQSATDGFGGSTCYQSGAGRRTGSTVIVSFGSKSVV